MAILLEVKIGQTGLQSGILGVIARQDRVDLLEPPLAGGFRLLGYPAVEINELCGQVRDGGKLRPPPLEIGLVQPDHLPSKGAQLRALAARIRFAAGRTQRFQMDEGLVG